MMQTRQAPFRFTAWATTIFAGLTPLAMLCYPGGTFRDPAATRYVFSRNFLSDLGMRVSWGGRPNGLAAALFVSGEILFATGLLTLFAGLVALAASNAAQRRWARAAAIAGVITSVGFIGAALTPEDRFLQLHLQSALLAFRGGFLSAVLLAVLIVRDHRFSWRGAFAWVLTAVLLAAYLVTIQWGPRLNTDFGLLVQATAQKVVFLAAVPSVLYISSEARRIVADRNRSS